MIEGNDVEVPWWNRNYDLEFGMFKEGGHYA